jgi:sulfite dehydrogenase (cytochrome) subunit B
MSNWRIGFVLANAAGLMVTVALHSQQPAPGASKPATKAGSSPVHSIVLPRYPPEIPKGPNVETYSTNCLLCHTARYVLMQPRFSKTVWQSEVKKMVDAYAASISEADQALIVEYLVAVKGVEAPATATPTPK